MRQRYEIKHTQSCPSFANTRKRIGLPIAVVDRIIAVDFDRGIVRVERFSVLFLLDEFVAFVLQLIGLLSHIIGQRYTHRLWPEEI